MPQVLFVNRYNGDFTFSDIDGKNNTTDGGHISFNDVSVLLERIKAGYTYVTPGKYVLVLDLAGTHPDDYFEFTHMLDFDTDDDGYPTVHNVPLLAQDHLDYLKSLNQSLPATSAIAVINYETNNLKWMANPLMTTPLVTDYLDVPRVDVADDDLTTIQTLGTRIALRDQPTWVSSIKVNFQKG